MFSFLPLFLAVMGWDDALILGGIAAAAGASGAGLTSWLGNRNAKKASNRDAKLNYRYAIKMALNGPSATVQGLRDANLNPILAATDGSFATPTMPSVSSNFSNDGSSGLTAGTNALNFALQAKQVDSNVETQETTAQLNKASAFERFVNGMNELKKGGHQGVFGAGYQALRSIGTSLGLTKDESASVLKMFGFDSLPKSHPEGSTTPVPVVKQQHHPLDSTHYPSDTKPVRTPVLDYLSPNERKSFEHLVDRYGYDAARFIFSGAFDDASHRKRTNDAFRRTHSRGHRVSPIYTR